MAIKGPSTDGGEERDRQAMLALKGPDDRGPSDPNMALVVAGGGSPTKQAQIDPAKAEADAASRDVVTLMERLRYAEREKQEALEVAVSKQAAAARHGIYSTHTSSTHTLPSSHTLEGGSTSH